MRVTSIEITLRIVLISVIMSHLRTSLLRMAKNFGCEGITVNNLTPPKGRTIRATLRLVKNCTTSNAQSLTLPY